MLRSAQKLLRLDRLERRLFGWLLILALAPLITLLAIGYVISVQTLAYVGTLGPWEHVAESGRALMDVAGPAAANDTALARALASHSRELSSSVTLARRWSFILQRLGSALPLVGLLFATLLIGATLWIGRRLAVQLARPILELGGWAERMAKGESLPGPTPQEQQEVREMRALRDAMRIASVKIGEARVRAVEAERVRAWGEMARRVAHEMKNPLTPLRLAAHRLAQHPEANSELREPLEVIEQETTRLDELARQFAVLGRPSSGPASDVDLRELLQDLLESDVPPHIQTKLHAPPQLPLVRAHYDALQRAFRNLIRNAVEAIGERAAQQTGGAAPLITVSLFMLSPERVRVRVVDSGIGIPADRIGRLFEPDFTLKAGGTGLGLAVVRQAIAAHGGKVSAASLDAGAEFTVELPIAGPPQ